ncbi:helix-turn-helix domain-containing protein [Paraburkholderia youngii]|uniref:Helix-turn-helix transcriptional regulator n=1 Tax=Paraburkholderia youngii TaxID=2782701 RepID=A0A7Y6JUC9_9BURK|nr:helix-turn-helix transcriptional regulator [Paraburkholderia youngii]NUX98885.1 helix-turn-helix transcriptional regulator [Paraburkholderia youngii]
MTAVDEQITAKLLGRALAAARADAGLTQEQVAEHLGVFVETVSRFERGANWPTVPRLLQLAELYGVPVSTLLQRGSGRAVDVSIEIAEQLERLSNDDRAWVGSLVRDLCKRLPATGGHKAGKRHR